MYAKLHSGQELSLEKQLVHKHTLIKAYVDNGNSITPYYSPEVGIKSTSDLYFLKILGFLLVYAVIMYQSKG